MSQDQTESEKTVQLSVPPTDSDPILPMRQRQGEPDVFLLWAMQDQSDRAKSYTCALLNCSKSSMKYWVKRWAWAPRTAAVSAHEIIAFQLLQARIAEFDDPGQLILIRSAYEKTLEERAPASLRSFIRRQQRGVEDPPMTREAEVVSASAPTPAVRGANEDSLYGKIKDKHLQVKDISRQVTLIDACLGLIAKKVQTGELKVSVRDIPALIKARALLTGLPTQNINVNSTSVIEHNVNVQSVRVQQAATKGLGERGLVAAMKEDLEELTLIMGQITPAEPGEIYTVYEDTGDEDDDV